ncbi:hypothetical protein ACFQI7_14345 [Paenibacillus allorhizosphaerae]|uniref:Uncharacterized protein n=1 Tax=Paenibacillus allorhizosphaerae TaxID=2849866 RepID=A0ABM8VDN7_9BACL|nr:hypothetical protein [Paenibacillus allorhizosphaerae]CAG7626430.1 hypothetical protein PAECIP111802_01249 [Paenibacillus allorhizosphaerae]
MKKLVIAMALLLTAVGCSAVDNPNQSAAPAPTSPQTDATAAPNNVPETTPPTTNPPAAPAPAPVAPAPEQTAPAPTPPKPVIPAPPTGAKEVPYVTKQQIDSVELNSTYDQVSTKIGLGKLVSQNEHQAIYQYQGKNGGTAKLIFWDGKLNSKGVSDLN